MNKNIYCCLVCDKQTKNVMYINKQFLNKLKYTFMRFCNITKKKGKSIWSQIDRYLVKKTDTI